MADLRNNLTFKPFYGIGFGVARLSPGRAEFCDRVGLAATRALTDWRGLRQAECAASLSGTQSQPLGIEYST